MEVKTGISERDIGNLLQDINSDHALEIQASHGPDMFLTLKQAVDLSAECFSFHREDKVEALIGVVPLSLLGNAASPWMVASQSLQNSPRPILKYTKPVVQHWSERWSILVSYIDARYLQGIRWAKWAGFEVDEPAPYGYEQKPFHRIMYRR